MSEDGWPNPPLTSHSHRNIHFIAKRALQSKQCPTSLKRESPQSQVDKTQTYRVSLSIKEEPVRNEGGRTLTTWRLAVHPGAHMATPRNEWGERTLTAWRLAVHLGAHTATPRYERKQKKNTYKDEGLGEVVCIIDDTHILGPIGHPRWV